MKIFIFAITLAYGWGSEAPREAFIALGIWIFGLMVGAFLAHKKIVKPAEERHEEIMESHQAIHDHLGIKK